MLFRSFPMFEFEGTGDFEDLKKLESSLVNYLGFKNPAAILDYEELCRRYDTKLLGEEHEERMCKDYGGPVILEKFPQRTQPYWNMKYVGGGIYNKTDVILGGAETIGSAERSNSPKEMEKNFYNVSKGEYANKLFKEFSKKRVLEELEFYFELNKEIRLRFGGGIGITRLESAMRKEGLFNGPNEI